MDEDDLDIDVSLSESIAELKLPTEQTAQVSRPKDDELERFMGQASMSKDSFKTESSDMSNTSILGSRHHMQLTLDNDFPIWAGDSSARRSPEGKTVYDVQIIP